MSSSEQVTPLALPGRMMLLARAGSTLVFQPADCISASEAEVRFLAATAPTLVDWLRALEQCPDADGLATDTVAARMQADLCRAAIAAQPDSVEAFREHAQKEILWSLRRIYTAMFEGAFCLGAHDCARFLEMVVELGTMVRGGEVFFSERAMHQAAERLAFAKARAEGCLQPPPAALDEAESQHHESVLPN